MFNFKLQNKAFDELNAEQFRLFYFLNSTLSMVNKTKNTPLNETIKMFNGYMMDKLGLSERQVQRLVKSLEDRGYISVERTTDKRQPNVIKIIGANNDDENGDNNSDTDDDNNDDTDCDKNGDKNVTPNKEQIKDNNQVLNSDESSIDKVIEEVKYLDGDSVNSSERNSDASDFVDNETKQQKEMNEESDKGAIGMKSAYGSTSGEQIKYLKECRPAPAQQRRTEEDRAFNKKVDEWKTFLVYGTKCLADFDEGFKGLAIAADNVVNSNGWTEKAQYRWFSNMNNWWANSKSDIYGNYKRNIEYERNRYKGTINPRDRFDEVCAPFVCKLSKYAMGTIYLLTPKSIKKSSFS